MSEDEYSSISDWVGWVAGTELIRTAGGSDRHKIGAVVTILEVLGENNFRTTTDGTTNFRMKYYKENIVTNEDYTNSVLLRERSLLTRYTSQREQHESALLLLDHKIDVTSRIISSIEEVL